MKKTIILSFLFLVCVAFAGRAQFQPASFTVNGFTLPYQVLFPQGYDESKAYPLVLFLHGAGERGDDNQKQLANGKDFLVNHFSSEYPAIVIVPQCPSGSYWADVIRHQVGSRMSFGFGIGEPTAPMRTLMLLVQDWLSSGKVDIHRIYVGGLSMGGMGTLEILWRMPQVFAAAFPICGGGETNRLPAYAKHTAVWLFHGADDSVVPVRFSREIAAKLKELGGEVKYTEYPGIDHNSWDQAFLEKDLVPWLFKHTL